MKIAQRAIAFAVFVVNAIGAWLRSLTRLGAAPTAVPTLALAQTQDRQGGASPAPPQLVPADETPEQHIHLPKPTIWPAMIAFGTTLFGFGVMSSRAFAVFGAIILLIGIAGWIGELRHA